MLRSLGIDPDAVLAGDVETPEDRFRVFDDVRNAVCRAADASSLVIVLDDIHWADESSLLVLRHLADQIAGARVLMFTPSTWGKRGGHAPVEFSVRELAGD